jgi:flagellar protein FliO/FliZ
MERGMQFMTALFGGTTNTLLNSAFALGIVLVGIVLGLWGLKLLTKAGGNLGRGRNKRLVVVDTATVDSKRQIVIIRRDNVEHVIMTGGPQDLIIESGVPVPEPVPLQPRRAPQRPAQPAPAATQSPPPDIDRPVAPERPVPREAVDRLRDLARPAPLKPRPAGTSLRHTNLLRPVMDAREERVIPMGPALRVDNSAGASSDSAKTAPVEAGGHTRFVGRNRFFRSVTRGEGK